jgi:predicted permease
MFDPEVFFLTAKTVANLLIFMLTGFFLRRKGLVGKEAAKTLSFLCSYLFLPAYALYEMPGQFTRDKIGGNLRLLGYATAISLFLIVVG